MIAWAWTVLMPGRESSSSFVAVLMLTMVPVAATGLVLLVPGAGFVVATGVTGLVVAGAVVLGSPTTSAAGPTTTRFPSCSMRTLPRPLTHPRSSIDLDGRPATIFFAVTSPTPGSVATISSAVALFRSRGFLASTLAFVLGACVCPTVGDRVAALQTTASVNEVRTAVFLIKWGSMRLTLGGWGRGHSVGGSGKQR